jgi:hypothetical protein
MGAGRRLKVQTDHEFFGLTQNTSLGRAEASEFPDFKYL